MNQEDRDLIKNIIDNRLGGDTCIETAEKFEDDVKDVDTRLYSALRRLNDAASDMTRRLRELNEELNLGFNEEDDI